MLPVATRDLEYVQVLPLQQKELNYPETLLSTKQPGFLITQ